MASPPPAAQMGAHDHHRCVARALAEIDALGASEEANVTPVRRKTLEVLLESHMALGAYDILKRLDAAGLGSQPPVAYRALEFLMAHGFVHKIERLNAYVACARPGEDHNPAFMVCRTCRLVAEADAKPQSGALGAAAAEAGFAIEATVVEAIGLCRACGAAA